MKYQEAKSQFVQSWGSLASSWGVSRTMAQIHALLMISPEALNADDVMEELGISRGNVSMSLKALMEWGLIEKKYVPGERKERFVAEKDIWRVATQIAKERRKRELEPVLHVLEKVSNIEDKGSMKSQVDEMNKITSDIQKFAVQSDNLLERFVKAEKHWFFSKILKVLK